MLVRRQGSGTFLARPLEENDHASPAGIRLGSAVAQLGRLETYASIAQRLGKKTESEQLRVRAAVADPDEAAALELPATSAVTRVSRVLRIDGEPTAWMLDVLPGDLIPAAQVRQGLESRQMVLDLLLDEGVAVGFSEVKVGAAMLGSGESAGKALKLTRPVAALSLTETMYVGNTSSAEGRPVQWSRNYFLPGKLSLHLIREMPASHDPAVVFQLLAGA